MQQEYNSENKLSYILNENNFTAKITKSLEIVCQILILNSTENQSNAFYYYSKNLKSIIFTEDSQIQYIGLYSFASSSIENIIPSSVKQIGEFSFAHFKNLKTIQFQSNSQLIKIPDNLFFYSSHEFISIPPNVEIIGERSFYYCNQFKTIEIPINSNLISIEKDAFLHSSIESIFIPSNLQKLEKGWCASTSKLNRISISDHNSCFSIYNESILLYHSKEGNETSIVFACRDIEKVTIPSNVKIIESSTFSECQKLNSIEFSPNSILVSICDHSFR